MRKLNRLRRRFSEEDHGAALPVIATMMVVLLGISALAIDLGWIYLNGSRVQRAADSAALAGVIYLPGDTANASAFAVNGANANGYNVGSVNGTPTGGGGPDALRWTALADNSLQVELDSNIPTFFLSVLGFDSFDISRTATAEYVKPVPLGSPDPCFGIGNTAIEGQDCDPASAQNFWAAISGPYTNKHNGDEHATRWWSDSGWSPPENANSAYRPEGYYLGVEVPAGVTDLDIDVYDAGFYDRPDFNTETGDNEQNTGGGTHTHFEFYNFDNTPLDPSDNTPIPGCRFDINSEASSGTFRNQWAELCSVANPPPGIYVVRIWTTGNLGGTNQYSVRATTTGGGDARVYGINDISIFVNRPSSISTMNLAEVAEDHAGKVLEIDLYDAGEDFGGNAFMEVKNPNGVTPNCDWVAFDESGSQTQSNSGNCRIQTSNGSPIFQGELLRIQIDLPSSYTCGADCWWQILIENNNPQDRTTWAARVIGNPVRLTPNP